MYFMDYCKKNPEDLQNVALLHVVQERSRTCKTFGRAGLQVP